MFGGRLGVACPEEKTDGVSPTSEPPASNPSNNGNVRFSVAGVVTESFDLGLSSSFGRFLDPDGVELGVGSIETAPLFLDGVGVGVRPTEALFLVGVGKGVGSGPLFLLDDPAGRIHPVLNAPNESLLDTSFTIGGISASTLELRRVDCFLATVSGGLTGLGVGLSGGMMIVVLVEQPPDLDASSSVCGAGPRNPGDASNEGIISAAFFNLACSFFVSFFCEPEATGGGGVGRGVGDRGFNSANARDKVDSR